MNSPPAFDAARLAAHPWLAGVQYAAETGSTNDWALAAAGQPELRCPHLFLTDQQRRGRGRGENSWWSAAGALTFTLLVDAAELAPPDDWPLIALTVGLAVAESLEPYAEGGRLQVKWPNDIYLEQKKLGGILVESARAAVPRFAIGIGINVNNSLAAAPGDVRDRATSLVDHAGECNLTDVLCKMLDGLQMHLHALASDRQWILSHWPKRCLLTGSRIEVRSGERLVRGICRGINPRGALLVEGPRGLEACFAGTVHWERGELI